MRAKGRSFRTRSTRVFGRVLRTHSPESLAFILTSDKCVTASDAGAVIPDPSTEVCEGVQHIASLYDP